MKWSGEPRAFALVADQTPKRDETKHWTRFLNQDTAFFPGRERSRISCRLRCCTWRCGDCGAATTQCGCRSWPNLPTKKARTCSFRALRAHARGGDHGEPLGLAVAAEEVEVSEAARRMNAGKETEATEDECASRRLSRSP